MIYFQWSARPMRRQCREGVEEMKKVTGNEVFERGRESKGQSPEQLRRTALSKRENPPAVILATGGNRTIN
jgi:hypothetical protein